MNDYEIIENRVRDLAASSTELSQRLSSILAAIRNGDEKILISRETLFQDAESWCRQFEELAGEIGKIYETENIEPPDGLTFGEIDLFLKHLRSTHFEETFGTYHEILDWIGSLESGEETFRSVLDEIREDVDSIRELLRQPSSATPESIESRMRPYIAIYFLSTAHRETLDPETPFLYYGEIQERFGKEFAGAVTRRALSFDSSACVLLPDEKPFSLKRSEPAVRETGAGETVPADPVDVKESSPPDLKHDEPAPVSEESAPDAPPSVQRKSPKPAPRKQDREWINKVDLLGVVKKRQSSSRSFSGGAAVDSPSLDELTIPVEPPPSRLSDAEADRLNRSICLSASTGHRSLAYQLSRVMEEHEAITVIPASFFRIQTLIPALSGELSSATEDIQEEFSDLSERLSLHPGCSEPCRTLLILASILWPGLVYPIAIPRDLFQHPFGEFQQERKIEPFLQLFREIKDVISKNEPYPLSLLQGNSQNKDWEARMNEVENNAQNWLNDNQSRDLQFSPASRLWSNYLVSNDGPLGKICGYIINRDIQKTDEMKDFISKWKDPWTIVKNYDIQYRGERASNLRPFKPFVKKLIKRYVSDFYKIVDRCLELWVDRPNSDEDRIAKKAEACRQTLLPLLEQGLQRSGKLLADENELLEIRTACFLFKNAAEHVLRIFQGNSPQIAREEDVRFERQYELLLVDELRLANDWTPIGGYPDDVEAMIPKLTDRRGKQLDILNATPGEKIELDWVAVLRQRWRENRFAEAEKILQVLQRLAYLDESKLKTLKNDHADHLRHARATLEQEKEQVQNALENAKMKGLIESEDDRIRLQEEINKIDPDECLDISGRLSVLREISREIDELKQKPVKDFEEEMRKSGILEDARWKDRITRLFEQEDLATAFEYLRLFKENGKIPEEDEMPVGCDFYPAFFEKAEEYFSGPDFNVPDFLEAVRNRTDLGEIDPGRYDFGPEDAEKAVSVLQSWFALKTADLPIADQKNHLQNVLSCFMMTVKDIKYDEVIRQYKIRIPTMETRAYCPLPDYGSDCEGRYNILRLTEWPLHAQEIFDDCLKSQGEVRCIIFYPGVLNDEQRREFAEEYIRNYSTRRVLVLDTALLLFCLLHPKRSRLAFFNGAGCFSMAKPYRTQAGTVPIEMFYGRNEEADALFARDGRYLLYGGRQLGKTALLKEVKRRKDDPDNGIVIEYIDIKAVHIGKQRPMDDIWNLIATKLPGSVLSSQVNTFNGFSEGVKNWLAKKTEHRILILLDETDDFLKEDKKNSWEYLLKFKNLMEETHRRFKIVFAGLHNVQQTSKDSNSPMHHLETAICIGPFLGLKEMPDAINMVRIPFMAMGFRFESPDTIGKILARSNYYPSLIQIFCSELLTYMQDRIVNEPGWFPPYRITSQDIEAVAARQSVQDDIRRRFTMTLDLDKKFRIIALAMAYQSFEQSQNNQPDNGFTVEEIMRMAMSYWHIGFQDTQTLYALRQLLREMVELGVLREDRSRFLLRSPNVQRLLGGSEEMLEQLIDASGSGPEPTPSNNEFRRVVDAERKWWRNPLTQVQENIVRSMTQHNVVVYKGSTASGIGAVDRVIESLGEIGSASVTIYDMSDITQYHEFVPELQKKIRSKRSDLTVFFIKASTPWTMDWITGAHQVQARNVKSLKNRVKIVFLADAMKCWEYLDDPLWGTGKNTEWISLEPWSSDMVRSWKCDSEFGVDNKEEAKKVLSATGYWWYFLTELGEKAWHRPEQWSRTLQDYFDLPDGDKLSRFNLLPEMIPVFRTMAEFEDAMSVEDILTICNDKHVEMSRIPRILLWGRDMNIVRNYYAEPNSTERGDATDLFRLDSFFARLVKASQ